MGKITMYLLIVLSSFSMACEKLTEKDKKVSFESDYYEMEFTIDAMDRGSQIFKEEIFKNDIENLLEINGINPEKLESVSLKEASIEILSNGAYKNFNVLNVMVITIYNDVLLTQKIGKADPVPKNADMIELESNNLNLKDYFTSPEFILSAEGYLNEPVYENIELRARLRFEIQGKI